jgi:hypothetical protein
MRQGIVTSAVISAFLLAGCGGSVKVAPQAVEEAAIALGGATRVVELSSDDISRLASQADVADDAIREVAPQADSQPLWSRAIAGARTVNERTEGMIRDVAIGVACDGVNGEIQSVEDVYFSLANQLQGLSESELESITTATVQMWQDLYDARLSDDPDLRAASVLVCYTISQVS